MPLRDHFHAPRRGSWEGVHALWASMIVLHLIRRLPEQYVAVPQVHLGSIEVDVATFDQPSLAVETELLDTSEYSVRILDTEQNRRLVAAIEIVSPSNKHDEDTRSQFVGKCEAMLRGGVSVVVVDLVTSMHFNLYHKLLALIRQRDPRMGTPPSPTYAAACRWIRIGTRHRLETWSNVLTVGQPLPTLPLWLPDDACIPLDLEASYEETCAALRIR